MSQSETVAARGLFQQWPELAVPSHRRPQASSGAQAPVDRQLCRGRHASRSLRRDLAVPNPRVVSSVGNWSAPRVMAALAGVVHDR